MLIVIENRPDYCLVQYNTAYTYKLYDISLRVTFFSAIGEGEAYAYRKTKKSPRIKQELFSIILI